MTKQARLFLSALLAILFISAPWSHVSAQAPQDEVPVPAGFENMFDEMAKLMKKYPGAAARFTLRDHKAESVSMKPKAGSFHACCRRDCTGSSHCTCLEWCLE